MATQGLSIGTLFIDLQADAKQYNKVLSQSEDKMMRTSKNIVRSARNMVVGVGAAAAGGFGLVKVASDAEEINSKFNVVFSDIMTQANAMAHTLDQSYGLARSEAEKLLSNTGDLLSGFGFTQQAALDLSSDVNKLAADLGSFQNVDVASASNAITKALLGEREAIKQLGISILEKDVQDQMALNTVKGLTFETERQAKAYATLQLAQEQSKNAIGDFARTQESFANQLKEFKADLHDTAVEAGQVLLPVASELLQMFRDGILDVKGFVAELQGMKEIAKDGLEIGIAVAKFIALNKAMTLVLGTGSKVAAMMANARTNIAGATPAMGSFAGTLSQVKVSAGAMLAVLAGGIVVIDSMLGKIEEFENKRKASESLELGFTRLRDVMEATKGDLTGIVNQIESFGGTNVALFDEGIEEGIQRIRKQAEAFLEIVPLTGGELKRYNSELEKYIKKQVSAAKATQAYVEAAKEAAKATADFEHNAKIAKPINDMASSLFHVQEALKVKDKLKLTDDEFSKFKNTIIGVIKAGGSVDEAARGIKDIFTAGLFDRESPYKKLKGDFTSLVTTLKTAQQLPSIQEQLGLTDTQFTQVSGFIAEMIAAKQPIDSIVQTIHNIKNAGLLKEQSNVEKLVEGFKDFNKELLITKKALDLRKELGLNNDQFSQMRGLIEQAVEAGLSFGEIKRLVAATIPNLVKNPLTFQGEAAALAPGISRGSQEDVAISARGRQAAADDSKKIVKAQERTAKAAKSIAESTRTTAEALEEGIVKA